MRGGPGQGSRFAGGLFPGYAWDGSDGGGVGLIQVCGLGLLPWGVLILRGSAETAARDSGEKQWPS